MERYCTGQCLWSGWFVQELFFYYHLPSFKTRGLTRNLDLNGFDGREYGKDSLLIFCIAIKQMTKCCKKPAFELSNTHVYNTMQKYPGSSCRLNGWQPIETKRVLTRNCKTWESKFPFIYHPSKRNGRWNLHWNKSVFFPHEYNDSTGLAVYLFFLQKLRNILHRTCIFSTALAAWDPYLLWGYLISKWTSFKPISSS